MNRLLPCRSFASASSYPPKVSTAPKISTCTIANLENTYVLINRVLRNGKSVSGLCCLFTLKFCHLGRDFEAMNPCHDFVRFQTKWVSTPPSHNKPITFGNELRTYDMIPNSFTVNFFLCECFSTMPMRSWLLRAMCHANRVYLVRKSPCSFLG